MNSWKHNENYCVLSSMLRWKRRVVNVQDVDTDCCIILAIRDLDADVVNTSLKLPGTYIGRIQLFACSASYSLTYLFALCGPCSYRDQVLCTTSLTTIEKTFRVFRQSIYNQSLLKLKELKKF